MGALLEHDVLRPAAPIEPLPTAAETTWLFAEVWAAIAKPGLSLVTAPARIAKLLHALASTKDAYFDPFDPLPFLALHLIHLPTLLIRNIARGNRWAKIDPCIGKLTEENGD